jgi:glycerol-3-phosphate acyltransferase PlsX
MRIVIDAMGGDYAPEQVVRGTLDAAAEWPELNLVLVGDEARVLEYMGSVRPANMEVIHAPEVILPEDEPVRAVRRKKGASMVVAGKLVAEGEADALISAGNTGALLATALFTIGRLPGIDRPALAPMIPTLDGVGLLALDLGANVDSKPEYLRQYGIMGSIYREKVDGIARPRVGLLNVGAEAKKGNELTKETFKLLSETNLNFIGNVEAREVLQHPCDVLVCDGFVGNILLKAIEGTAGTLMREVKGLFMANILSKLAALSLKSKLQELKDKMDYKEHGAAPLLGVRGLVLKSHGSSNARAIRNAVLRAKIAIEGDLIPTIAREMEK